VVGFPLREGSFVMLAGAQLGQLPLTLFRKGRDSSPPFKMLFDALPFARFYRASLRIRAKSIRRL
jgi:hypothetical protein